MIPESDREENIQSYIRQITLAQEEERKRIARDLHDDISSRLLLLIKKIETMAAQSRSKNARVKQDFSELRDRAVDALEALRRTAQGLRPRLIDDLGLVAAVEWLAEETEKHAPFTVSVTSSGMAAGPSGEVSIVLFRIAQEALTNIRKHAGARHVSINIIGSREDVRVEISDDGKGFTVPESVEAYAQKGHLGLIGMQERARLMNGTLDISSSPGKGTTITASLPLGTEERR